MKQEMLINVSQPEECRIGIVEDGVLEELYIERTSQDNYVGNIYKGKVVNIEPSIQAAFVDFGVGRNGFLHISDIEPQYFRQGGYDPDKPLEPGGRRGGRDSGAIPARATPAPAIRPLARMAIRPTMTRPTTSTLTTAKATVPKRAPAAARSSASALGRASSRRSKTFCAAATNCSCKSSRRGSAPRGPRFPRISASPAAIWC